MAFMSVYIPYPGRILSSASFSLFHFANEWTTSALASPSSLIGNVTARSIPLRSSLMPSPLSTKSGAVTRLRRNSVLMFCWKNSLISFIPCSVCAASRRGLYPCGLISLLIVFCIVFFARLIGCWISSFVFQMGFV